MESNVRSEFYEKAVGVNKTAVGAHVQTYFPITSNITSGVISGQVVWEFNTGAGEYLDLYKSHIELEATDTKTAADNAYFGDQPLSNIFSRGQLYINGKRVASSNNWTQDAILSKRITHSAAYNKSINGYDYTTVAPVDTGHPGAVVVAGATTITDIEYLDALFLRTQSCIVPPNCNVRLVLDVDAAHLIKMSTLVVAAAKPDNYLYMNGIKFIAYTIVKDEASASEVLPLVTLNSFVSGISGTTENRQYTVQPSIVKAAVTCQSTAYATGPAGAKVYAGNYLTYATDTSTTMMTTLDAKLNNIVIPNSKYDFTYGFKKAWTNFLCESGHISNEAGSETYTEYCKGGMIHLFNVVKSEKDKSNSLQVNCTFLATPAARLIITAFEENNVVFTYDTQSGALIDTQTTI